MKPIDSQLSHILPSGTKLPHNYIIHKMLGEGGFGITYSGTSNLTGEKVAIKEYFPTGLAHRTQTADTLYQVIPFQGMEDAFEKGRQHFLNEAIILKEFQNLDSIVAVRDVIETNDTVYLVMEFVDGITLKQYIEENGVLSFQELLPLIQPVILSLTQIHKKGLLHRDISPENLMVGVDNQLHLIDFGAASVENVNATKTMTVILKSGYAPPEQYLSDSRQGPWTDVYALCSTMYMVLTGFAPPESIRRIQHEDLPPLIEHADVTPWQAAAIEKGMSLNHTERFQDMETLYQALIIPPLETISQQKQRSGNALQDSKTVIKPTDKRKQQRKSYTILLPVAILLVILFMAGIWIYTSRSSTAKNPDSDTQRGTTVATTEATVICSMIDITGHPLAEAKSMLHELDSSIMVTTTWTYSDEYEENIVIDQSVQNGTDFEKGSLTNLLLTVSKGAEPTTETATEATTEKITEAPVSRQEYKTNTQKSNSNTQKSNSQPATSAPKEDDIYVIPEDEDDHIIYID